MGHGKRASATKQDSEFESYHFWSIQINYSSDVRSKVCVYQVLCSLYWVNAKLIRSLLNFNLKILHLKMHGKFWGKCNYDQTNFGWSVAVERKLDLTIVWSWKSAGVCKQVQDNKWNELTSRLIDLNCVLNSVFCRRIIVVLYATVNWETLVLIHCEISTITKNKEIGQPERLTLEFSHLLAIIIR